MNEMKALCPSFSLPLSLDDSDELVHNNNKGISISFA